jgi:antitoxin component YwqK of YwqJK toxin-antitoxin module
VKKIAILLLVIVFLSFKIERQTHKYENDEIRCTYQTNNGRIDGAYVSYYKNGQKKAEGNFLNNYRIGKWTVYDSTGKISIQRDYKSPFDYGQTINKVSLPEIKELKSAYISNLHNNAQGFIDYFELQEKMIIWSKRICRNIIPAENKILFVNNKLFDLLFKNISEGKITAYKDDNFSKEETTKFDTSAYRVIGYKIEEDYVFDNIRYLLETRILGLCPVVINMQKQDTVDLCWFYFPEIRQCLALEKINQNNATRIKTLDDLFFYRDFYGKIYKEANLYNRSINNYIKNKEEIGKEAERIEISIIEEEHDLWLDITNK